MTTSHEAPATPAVLRRRQLEGRLAARLELERRAKARLYRHGADGAWAWLTDCVWTEDPHDRCFKPFPGREPWAQYLKHVVTLYCEPTARLVLVAKARRMFLSWLSIALRVWRAGHFAHESIYFDALKLGLNENEPGSALEMLRRARQILVHLQGEPIPFEAYRAHIEFPQTQSRIVAVGSGADQLRGATATDILMDECASWPEAEGTFIAGRPTIEQVGRLWMVSTVKHGSFFSEMRHDRIGFRRRAEDTETVRRALPLAPGVALAVNPRNRAHVLEILPTADPRKRSAEWVREESAGMSLAAWRQEYELDDTNVFGGTPVFEGVYDDTLMVRPAPLARDPKRPLLRAWDWGYRHPVVVVGQLYDARQLRVYAAWMGTNVDLEVFAAQCLRRCRERWPDVPFLDAGDHAGTAQRGQGLPEVDLLRQRFGILVATRYMKEAEPLAWLRRLMRDTYRPGEPAFLVEDNPDTADLRRALAGGYVLDKQGKPADDGYFEHYGDALKYLYNFEWEGTTFADELDRAALADVLPEKHYADE